MRTIVAVLFTSLLPAPAATDAGFRLNPGNPRCFLYQNKPVVLITATEHYGAVLNGDFDYGRYLDVLAENGLNLSRLFTFYRELEDSIAALGYANTLAPRPGGEVMPWMRAGPGSMADGGLKFDLTRWNPAYFDRLKDFMRQAARRNVIVELVFFCNPYDDKRLAWFPFHRDSNVNGVGGGMTSIFHFMERRGGACGVQVLCRPRLPARRTDRRSRRAEPLVYGRAGASARPAAVSRLHGVRRAGIVELGAGDDHRGSRHVRRRGLVVCAPVSRHPAVAFVAFLVAVYVANVIGPPPPSARAVAVVGARSVDLAGVGGVDGGAGVFP
jgi:hypothetical protein